jgi:hypothetical protein
VNEETQKSGVVAEDPLTLYIKNLLHESKQGKILLLAAKIDEMLAEILKGFFKEHRKSGDDIKLFGAMGPLGSFAIRTEMAYRVGLISNETAGCFDILRKIRNDCAHGLEPFAFENEKNAQQFERFKKLSFTVAGMGKQFELFEHLGLGQDRSKKVVQFLVIAMNHMLLLQGTLNKLRRVADSILDLENEKFLVPALTKILMKSQ